MNHIADIMLLFAADYLSEICFGSKVIVSVVWAFFTALFLGQGAAAPSLKQQTVQ